MAEHLPAWMDNNFFTQVLEEKGQKVTVLTFDAEPALPPGENYTSILLRVKVHYRVETSQHKQTVSWIVKVPIDQVFWSLNEKNEIKTDFLEKEPKIYRIFLPFVYEKINQQLGPVSYFSPIENVNIMEDLKEGGYVMCKGQCCKQLDYQHCAKVIENIAKFHACSVRCYKENPTFIKSMAENSFWVEGTAIEKWIKTGTKHVLEVAKELNADSRFIDFLSPRLDEFYKGLVKMNEPKIRGLNVLNHGDLRETNFMIKHDNTGKVLDVKFIDFQIPKWASPACDLTYFVWSSANEDVRTNRQTDLYNLYLTTFNQTLEQLGCEERLSREELYEDLTSAKDWVMVCLSLCLPNMTTPKEEFKLDFENFGLKDIESEQFRNHFRSKHFQSVLVSVLKNYSDFFLSDQI